jgi:hypothetical protein
VNGPSGNTYYVARRENNLSLSSMQIFSNNAILVYGIDFLNERRIEQYFSPYMVSV